MTTGGADGKLRWIVCEDGTEYLERYQRFLGAEFEFVPSSDATALTQALVDGAAGVILDLDFRRTPPDRLVDEQGACHAALPQAERRRLAESQGILILRRLRARGLVLPVLLCADLDDVRQAAWLEGTLAPLQIVPSHESLLETAARMRLLAG